MNKLPIAKRAQILNLLCEGSSMRSVSRLTDTSINTVAKLLVDAGRFCARFHDDKVRGVKARRVQVDEIWSFTYSKQKNVKIAKAAPEGAGDTWTWTGIEADTKLIVSQKRNPSELDLRRVLVGRACLDVSRCRSRVNPVRIYRTESTRSSRRFSLIRHGGETCQSSENLATTSKQATCR